MKSKLALFPIASFAMIAMGCNPPSVSPIADAAPIDAGSQPDALDVDAGDAFDAGPSYPITYACTEPCEIQWRELPPFITPIDHHTTFVLERDGGPYLYVLGGLESDGSEVPRAWNRRISAAPIEDDGTLGEWEHEDFGFGIAFHAQVDLGGVSGTRMAWIGGVTNDPATGSVAPEANAMTLLADFRPGPGSGIVGVHLGGPILGRAMGDLPEAVLHGTAGLRDHLFLIGGGAGSTLSDAALRYTDATHGWLEDAPLPTVRSHHAMVTIDNRFYVLGGFSGTNTAPVDANAIVRSIHAEDGSITGWEEVGTMAAPPWTASAFVRDGFLYVVGGGSSHDGHATGFLDRVRRAPIDVDGTIGAFADVANSLPIARGHVHQTPVLGDHVYSVGGRVSDGASWRSTDRVFVGTFLH